MSSSYCKTRRLKRSRRYPWHVRFYLIVTPFRPAFSVLNVTRIHIALYAEIIVLFLSTRHFVSMVPRIPASRHTCRAIFVSGFVSTFASKQHKIYAPLRFARKSGKKGAFAMQLLIYSRRYWWRQRSRFTNHHAARLIFYQLKCLRDAGAWRKRRAVSRLPAPWTARDMSQVTAFAHNVQWAWSKPLQTGLIQGRCQDSLKRSDKRTLW